MTVSKMQSSPIISQTLSSTTDSQEKDSQDSYHPQSQQSTSSSPPSKKSRGTINIYTPKLVSALDKAKVSSRDTVHIICAVLEAANLDAENYIVNKTSIHKKEKQFVRKITKLLNGNSEIEIYPTLLFIGMGNYSRHNRKNQS